MDQPEIFRRIPDFPNYLISNRGRVMNRNTERIMKQTINERGYAIVGLCNGDPRGQRNMRVHRLVASVFIPNTGGKEHCDHIDGQRTNNIISNLRWATREENQANQKISNRNRSGAKGVHYDLFHRKWRASITHKKRIIHLGFFQNKDDAVAVRREAAAILFGEFLHQCERV